METTQYPKTKRVAPQHYTVGDVHIRSAQITSSSNKGGFEVTDEHGELHHFKTKKDAVTFAQDEWFYSGSCNIDFQHCEQCGRPAEGSAENEGYSGCCNELIVWGSLSCRNHHGKVVR